ncbi:MAG: M48 family metallopeptidase [Defluviitaleaceae bacterium]|nr:M48 family metallopeptidase [Defluviitaleaceae bacterium]MCL2262669.1 M48 family metallopeptidase [Defluviitaleaceae bacterium]
MTYTLTRSNRKTVAIHVRNGEVEVRAPLRMPKRDIDRFVSEKENWIAKNLSKQQSQAEKKKAFVVNYGSFIPLMGAKFCIEQRNVKRAGFDGNVFYMPQGLSPEQIKHTCVKIYKMLAKVYISKRVDVFSALMGVTPTAVKINGAMKRWGSCSSRKSLNFSWRLIMAEDAVVDYVVVHELAHLKEMNHSTRFWAIVEDILPDYRARETKLKELQRHLSNEDWE